MTHPTGGNRPPTAGARATYARRVAGNSRDRDRRLAAGPAGPPGLAGRTALSRLTELAAQLLGTASAQVSLISDVQHVLGGAGAAATVVGTDSPAAQSLCTVTVNAGRPVAVADAGADERVATLPPVTNGSVGAYLGVPLVTTNGHTVGALCVFGPEPRSWSDSDVALLEQLATPVVAELELATLTADYENDRLLWQLAVDTAGIGVYDWDLLTGELRWDERLLALFGLAPDTFGGTIEAFNARVHPDDLPRVSQALANAVETVGEFATEYRILLPDGTLHWVGARGRALPGPDGRAVRVLGAAWDTTAVQEGEARVARVLESMPTAFFHLDRDWRFSYANPEAEQMLGMTRGDLVGRTIWELFPSAVGSDFEHHYREAVASGEPVTFDAYYPPPLDAWYEVNAWPSPDGLSVYFVDVTDRHAAQQQLDATARRTALQASVSDALTGTLDIEEAMSRLAPVLVPVLGDWCIVTLADDTSRVDWRHGLRDVGTWHTDEAQRGTVEQYARLRLPALTDASFLARAMTSSRPVVIPSGATEAVAAVLAPGEARDLILELDPESGVVMPLRGRGRTVGLLTIFRGADRGPFDREDLGVLADLAARAGLALDNARLYGEQRDLAEGLQRSLMTAPPEPEHLRVAVRYEPAAQAAQVGGDWYDAFLQRDGAAVLVIGDVVGHDTAAAAAMGQVRGLLRGIAVHSGDGPAAVLRGVDRVMETLQVDTTATAVVARLQGPEADGVTRLCWSNAGHPPPVVLHRDGTVSLLEPPPSDTLVPDLLLGFDPETERNESEVALEPGATVLLYTDGLVERRGQTYDEGARRLARTLAELAGTDASVDELCDQLLARMLPERPEDDVALVAVRLLGTGSPAEGAGWTS